MCCRWCFDLLNCLLTFFSSLFDVGSDLINSLDFLGYNVSSTNVNVISLSSVTNTPNNTEEFEVHQRWGIFGISLIFLPGYMIMPMVFVALASGRGILVGGMAELIIATVLLAMYPILLIIIQVVNVVMNGSLVNKKIQQLTLIAVGAEAFFESFSQMVLQGNTILYGYEVTVIQIITVIASFILLARTAILYDITMTKGDMEFTESLTHTIKTFPCYATIIIFRVLAFSLTIAYLRVWSIIPIFILFVELVVIAYIRYRNLEKGWKLFMAIYLSSISNGGVLVANNLLEYDRFGEFGKELDDEAVEGGRKFVRLSSIASYTHHAVVLMAIMVLVKCNPDYLQQAQFQDLILKPDGPHFFWVFGGTMVLGFYGMTQSLYLANNIVNIKASEFKF